MRSEGCSVARRKRYRRYRMRHIAISTSPLPPSAASGTKIASTVESIRTKVIKTKPAFNHPYIGSNTRNTKPSLLSAEFKISERYTRAQAANIDNLVSLASSPASVFQLRTNPAAKTYVITSELGISQTAFLICVTDINSVISNDATNVG